MKSGLNSYTLNLLIFTLSFTQLICANEKTDLVNTNFKIDFRSMHIWRGFATSYSPTVEPSFEVAKNNYSTGIWFARSLDGNYTELDLHLTYELKDFSFTIYDYYCPPSIQASNEIANYKKLTTDHIIELNLAYNGSEYFPLKILLASMVYGNDFDSKTNKSYYSTYLQFSYSSEIDNNIINLFLGLSPFRSFYGDKIGIVNAGLTASRNLNFNKSIAIPIQASLITNPSTNSLFLCFGFTL